MKRLALGVLLLVAGCRRAPSGEVAQPGTKLVWLRCAVGQKWDGAQCVGERLGVSWDRAEHACPAGFRVPTAAEYSALLGGCTDQAGCHSCRQSADCTAMFGSDDDGYYWSSTTNEDGSQWLVCFFNGDVNDEPPDVFDYVRCVR